MTYNLFIDDIRDPHYRECRQSGVNPRLEWVIARTSEEAKKIVLERGMPERMALDHDLGYVEVEQAGELTFKVDEVPTFLKWLVNEFWNGSDKVPEYTIHSANPVGAQNMRAFMESWKKACEP